MIRAKHLRRAAGLLAISCLVTSASAELIAGESFDYPLGAVSDASGGTGWDGAWRDAAGNPAGVTVAAGMTQSGVASSGGALEIGATDITRFRLLSPAAVAAIQQQQASGGELWLSFMGRNTGASGKGFMLAQMSGYADTAANRKVLVGTNLFTGNSWSWTNETTVGNGNLSGIDTTNPVLLVMHFDFTSATSSQTRMYLFGSGVADATQLANASYTSNVGANSDAARQPVFDRLRVSTRNLRIDEIRLATSFADLVPPALPLAPEIAAQPAAASAAEFGTHTFTVQATGTPPLAYQWKKNGEDLPGKTAATLQLSNLSSDDAGTYSVVVTNGQGSDTSDAAALTVQPYPRDLGGAQGLLSRILPTRAKSFSIAFIPPQDGRDVFEVESSGDKIVLRGNTGVSVASALNHYLKHFCFCHVSRNGSQLAIPTPLPAVPEKVRVVSPHRVRFFYNPCTFGYTSAWWDWAKWEREIDLLAMSGVNIAQVTPGTEEVLRRTLLSNGYTDAEVRAWLCMPSHLPWMLLANMHSFAGPVPDVLIDRRAVLGRQMCDRMRALGMQPMVPGFYGMVPQDFATRHPGTDVRGQGTWAGGFQRPNMLNPTDPVFADVAEDYYEAAEEVFGELKYFAADPFHEGGSTAGINLPQAAQAILAGMNHADPACTWVLEAWGGNPIQVMLDAVDKSRLLVLDLNCSTTESWRSRNAFNQTPWVWCAIQNFGGNTAMDAKLGVLASKPAVALNDAARGPMAGIGAVPEGCHSVPATWELLMEHGWRNTAVDLKPWVRDYARRRYGKSLAGTDAAWADLLASAQDITRSLEEPHNSIINGRPSLSTGMKARTWSTTDIPYDAARLAAAWGHLLDSAPQLQGADAYRFDLADVARQTLCDLATRHQRMLAKAYSANDAAKVHQHGDRILEIITDLDTLCATRREFLLGPWLADARSWGETPAEKNLCERSARLLLSTWGANTSDLNDYANREWAGLISGFYRPRWQQFLTSLYQAVDSGTAFNEGAVRNSIAAWELTWSQGTEAHLQEPQGDTITVAAALWAKYGAEAGGDFDRVSKNIGSGWTPSDCSGAPIKWSRDVSSVVTAAGTWAVRFQYTSGSHALQINDVALRDGSSTIARDQHPGWTGFDNYDTRYYLKLPELPASGLSWEAVTQSAGGSDSNGTISFVLCNEAAVGSTWSPAQVSTTPTIWSRDVTALVQESGGYRVTLQHGSGANLTVDRVWLEQGGEVVAAEIRDEVLTTATPEQAWGLSVNELAAGQPVILKVAVVGATAAGSSGAITVERLAESAANFESWQDWAGENGVSSSAPDADSDQDGASNLLEYLAGSDPQSPDAENALAIDGSRQLQLRMARHRLGLDLTVEASPGLGGWAAEDDLIFVDEIELPGDRVQRTYQSPAGPSQRFFRLRVEQEDGGIAQ